MGRASAVDYLVEFEAAIKIGEYIFQSGLAPAGVRNGAAAAVLILTGHEYGMSWMQSMRLFHVIGNKAVLSSDAMMGLINDHCRRMGGGYAKVIEETTERCTVEFQRHDRSDNEYATFSMDDAKRANLANKETWKAYPQDMLRARAQARACRRGWPEIVGGMYDPDELSGSSQDVGGSAGGYVEVQRPTAIAKAIETKIATGDQNIIDADTSNPIPRDNASNKAQQPRQTTAAKNTATEANPSPRATPKAIADLKAFAAEKHVDETDLLKLAWFNCQVQQLEELDGKGMYSMRSILQRPIDELSIAVSDARDCWDDAIAKAAEAELTGEEEDGDYTDLND